MLQIVATPYVWEMPLILKNNIEPENTSNVAIRDGDNSSSSFDITLVSEDLSRKTVVYVVVGDPVFDLIALDGRSGKELWRCCDIKSTDESIATHIKNTPKVTSSKILEIYSSPTVAPDGTIYVLTLGNGLLAISSEGTLRWVCQIV